MSLQNTRNRFMRLAASAGRAALHHQFPDDFEYYMCAFELVNRITGKAEEILVFPIMPDSIMVRKAKLTNIRKSSSGIIITTNPTFNPVEISISGTFGRKFRFLLGNQNFDFGAGFNISTMKSNLKKIQFDDTIKTGYGVTKKLERMFELADTLDQEGNFYQLFFYNFALNSHWLVEPLDLTLTQSKETNTMWNYSMSMKGVAPANEIRNTDEKTTATELLTYDNLQKGLGLVMDVAREQTLLLTNKLLANGKSGHI